MKINENQNTAGVTGLSPRPAQHTPLPWTAEGATRIWHTGPGYGAVAIIADPECKNSGDFKEVDPTCARWDEAMANAEFIVRAVNSHEALVSAAARALAFLEGRTTKLGGERSLLTIELRDVLEASAARP